MKPAQQGGPGRDADSVARRVVRGLRSEPWWLRGVTWGMVGMIAAIMLAASSFTIVAALMPEHTGWRRRGSSRSPSSANPTAARNTR